MTEQNTPKEPTVEDLYNLIKSGAKGPRISWLNTVIQLIVTLLVVGTAAVIYVGSTSEKEGKEAAARVEAPLVEKIGNLEENTSKSIDRLEKATTHAVGELKRSSAQEVGDLRRTIEDTEERNKEAMGELGEDIAGIALEQKAITTKIFAIDKRQAVMEASIKTIHAPPIISP